MYAKHMKTYVQHALRRIFHSQTLEAFLEGHSTEHIRDMLNRQKKSFAQRFHL